MKALRLFVLVVFFLHSKTGVALNLHYCGGHLASVSWIFMANGCGMETPTEQKSDTESQFKSICCADSALVAQDQTPQTSESYSSVTPINTPFIAPPLRAVQQSEIAILASKNFAYGSPPREKYYQRYCQFIFYG